MKQTGEEYRLKNRQRLQKFYQKHEAQGKKRVSALITGAAYDLMMDAKEQTGASISDLVDKALVDTFTAQEIPEPVQADDTATTTHVDAEKNMTEIVHQNGKLVDNSEVILPKNEGQDPVTDAQADEKKKRALQILEIEKQYPGRKNAQARADAMNDAGVLKKGAACQWDKISTKNAILGARKTLGIK